MKAKFIPLFLFIALSFYNTGFSQEFSEKVLIGDQVVLTASGAEGPFQWQESSDNISWIDIDGAVESSYTFVAAGIAGANKFYRAALLNTSCGSEDWFYSPVIHYILIENISDVEPGDHFRGGIAYNYTTDGAEKRIASTQDDTTAVRWGCVGQNIHTNYEDGRYNTTTIMANCNERPIAVSVCDESELNGYADWHLPSYQELYRLNQAKDLVGGFVAKDYWTSTATGTGTQNLRAWGYHFSLNLSYSRHRNETDPARCIRPVLTSDTTRSMVVFEELPTAVSITSHPEAITVCSSAPAILSVTAEGTEPFTYQWFKDGEELMGFTQSTLNITDADLNDEGLYSCEITNVCGTVSSEEAEFKVIQLTVNAGDDDEFCIAYAINASALSNHPGESGTLQYAWLPAEGLSNPSILNPEAQPEETTTYTLTVTDEVGCITSDSLTLTLTEDLDITLQPATQAVCKDAQVEFSVATEGGSSVSYQWKKDGQPIDNATGNIYSIASATFDDEGIYTCMVTHDCGSISTEDAELKVIAITANAGQDEVICLGSQIPLNAIASSNHPVESGDFTWLWEPASGLSDPAISNPEAGPENNTEYRVTATDALGCADSDTLSVQVKSPWEYQQVCLASVEPVSQKTQIMWSKTPEMGIAGFNIYRSTDSGTWDFAGYVPFDEPALFTDPASHPDAGIQKYRIAVVDTCGNESSPSYYHSSVFLQLPEYNNPGELSWNHYDDEAGAYTPSAYYIYRGTSPDAMIVLDSVPSTISNYSVEIHEQVYLYKIGILRPEGCTDSDASSASYSNIVAVDAGTFVAHPGFPLQNEIIVSPNPFREVTTIRFSNPANEEFILSLTDSKGQTVLRITGISNETVTLSGNDLKSGVYFIDLRSSKRILRGKMVVE